MAKKEVGLQSQVVAPKTHGLPRRAPLVPFTPPMRREEQRLTLSRPVPPRPRRAEEPGRDQTQHGSLQFPALYPPLEHEYKF